MLSYAGRCLFILDTPEGRAVIINTQYDWTSAFDRQDPTITIQKFVRMKVRSSLIPILIDFLSQRSMKIKYNQQQAGPFELVGGLTARQFFRAALFLNRKLRQYRGSKY